MAPVFGFSFNLDGLAFVHGKPFLGLRPIHNLLKRRSNNEVLYNQGSQIYKLYTEGIPEQRQLRRGSQNR